MSLYWITSDVNFSPFFIYFKMYRYVRRINPKKLSDTPTCMPRFIINWVGNSLLFLLDFWIHFESLSFKQILTKLGQMHFIRIGLVLKLKPEPARFLTFIWKYVLAFLDNICWSGKLGSFLVRTCLLDIIQFPVCSAFSFLR